MEHQQPDSREVSSYFFRIESMALRSFAMMGIFLLLAMYSIYMARPVLMPVVIALLLSFLLNPVHRFLVRLHLPRLVAALILMAAFVGVIGMGLMNLIQPATVWFEKLPANYHLIESKLHSLKEHVTKVTQAAEQVDKLTSIKTDSAGTTLTAVTVTDPASTTRSVVFVWMQTGIGNFVVISMLMLFFLAYGGSIYDEISEYHRPWRLLDDIGKNISVYLVTITMINAGLGVCVAIAMSVLGLPNPLLWGVMAAVLEFIPYIGAIIGIGIVFLVSLLTFDHPSTIFLPAAVYFILVSIEGQFITPMVLGKRLTLNPIFIVLSLLFWGWIWGFPGALIGIPVLMAFKITCDHMPNMLWLGKIMSAQNGETTPPLTPSASTPRSFPSS